MKKTIAFLCLLLLRLIVTAQERKTMSLNQNWQFAYIDKEINYVGIDTLWQPINLPHTWNNTDIQTGNKIKYGTGWYRKKLFVAPEKDKKYFLRFEGVGQYAEVYINGKPAGRHLGGYSAFVINITGYLDAKGENSLAVKVNNELAASYPKDNFLFGIYGGIYRDVNLIETSEVHFSLEDYASAGVYIQQKEINSKKATINIAAQVKNETSQRQDILVKNILLQADGKIVKETDHPATLYPGNLLPLQTELSISNPVLWQGRENPYRYTLQTEIWADGKMTDRLSQKIGLRSFFIDPEKGFFLNGKSYRLHGVCRHQEWENDGNALSPEQHRQDMEMIYDIGANTIRLAHYQQADYIYELADSLGILIWAEIPFINGYKEGADENAKQQLTELIKQNFNHTSIFVWGLHNEVIKGNEILQPVRLTRELNSIAKSLDPYRYTISVSNTWWNYDHPIQELADLQGFNQYTGWYGGKAYELENFVTAYHKAKPDVRFAISEYGADGNIHQHAGNDTVPPDPTGQFFPENYQTFYHETTWPIIEKYPFIWASYAWNMFDFATPEWDRGGVKARNQKGLVTYDRKIKKDAFYWYKANWSKEQVLHLTGYLNPTANAGNIVFKAYSNAGRPELFIDGKTRGILKEGNNHVLFLSNPVNLEKGTYNIEIKIALNDKTLSNGYTLEVK